MICFLFTCTFLDYFFFGFYYLINIMIVICHMKKGFHLLGVGNPAGGPCHSAAAWGGAAKQAWHTQDSGQPGAPPPVWPEPSPPPPHHSVPQTRAADCTYTETHTSCTVAVIANGISLGLEKTGVLLWAQIIQSRWSRPAEYTTSHLGFRVKHLTNIT